MGMVGWRGQWMKGIEGTEEDGTLRVGSQSQPHVRNPENYRD